MSDDRVPAPLEAIVRAIAGARDDDDQRATTFARGLALGALVGAAIAGSTIWQRRHNRFGRAASAETPVPRGGPPERSAPTPSAAASAAPAADPAAPATVEETRLQGR